MMKTYWRYLLLFLLPLATLLVAMEYTLRRIPNDYSFKHERMLNGGTEFRFLVLGSSHAYRGVEPDSMGGVGFSAANISQDLSYDRAVLERYLPNMPNLESVVLPVSYGSLGGSLERGKEGWRVKNYALYMAIDKDANKLEHHLEIINRPMREQTGMLIKYLINGEDNRVCTMSGAGSRPNTAGIDLEGTGKEAAARHYHPSVDRTKEGKEQLEELVRIATIQGINVYLFTPPAWATYTDQLDSAQLNTAKNTCRALASTNALVHYRDLMNDPRFLKSDFADADHVSVTGQAKLSRILGEWIGTLGTDSAIVPNNTETGPR